MTRNDAVAVFGSSQTSPGSTEWAEAEMAGAALARAGLAVITGGYGGTMEAASKGASTAGGHVIGVTAPNQFPRRPGANRFVDEEIHADVLTDRIGIMVERARGVIALPGSIGTATELLIAWNTNHIVRTNGGRSIPTVAVGHGWTVVAETLVSEVDAFPGDIHLAGTVDEAVRWLLDLLKIRRD